MCESDTLVSSRLPAGDVVVGGSAAATALPLLLLPQLSVDPSVGRSVGRTAVTVVGVDGATGNEADWQTVCREFVSLPPCCCVAGDVQQYFAHEPIGPTNGNHK